VSGDDDVGGLVGYNSGTLTNCYSIGNVSGNTNVGGLVGYNSGTVTNSFWDTLTSGISFSNGGTGKNTSQMKRRSTFTSGGWDFEFTWYMYEDITYPLLITFLDGDNDAPIFGTDFTPSSGGTGDSFTFNISVSDNMKICYVYVEYWFGNGSHANVSMKGDNPYTFTITIFSNSTKTLHYIFHARDIVGNWNETPKKDVIIFDNDAPIFGMDSTPGYGTTGDPYTFNITVLDNIHVQTIAVEYWIQTSQCQVPIHIR